MIPKNNRFYTLDRNTNFFGMNRQEIYVYQLSSRINFHLEMNNPEEVTKLENDFAEEIKKRGEDFKYFKDQV